MATTNLRPISNGDRTEWPHVYPTNIAHWQAVDETTSDDNTTRIWVKGASAEVIDLFNCTQLDLPIGTTFASLTVKVMLLGGAARFRTIVKTHNVEYHGAIKLGVGDPDGDYNLIYDTWTTNPYTGTSWTQDELNSVQIGVVAIQYVSGGCSPTNSGERDATMVWGTVEYTVPNIELTQKCFRFYTDDAGLNSATAKANENTSLTNFTAVQTIRLRIATECTGDYHSDVSRVLQWRTPYTAWADVAADTGDVQLEASPNYADFAATTKRLTGSSYTFTAGEGKDRTNSTTDLELNHNYYVEDEWCLRVMENAAGKTLEFRLVNVDTGYDTYTVTPSITVITPVRDLAYIYPSGDVDVANWHSSAIGGSCYELIDDYIIEPTLPDITKYVYADTLGVSCEFSFSNIHIYDATILTIRLWVYSKLDSLDDTLRAQFKIDGEYSVPQTFELTTGYAWRSVEISGIWTVELVNDLTVKLLAGGTGDSTRTVYAMYCELEYAIPYTAFLAQTYDSQKGELSLGSKIRLYIDGYLAGNCTEGVPIDAGVKVLQYSAYGEDNLVHDERYIQTEQSITLVEAAGSNTIKYLLGGFLPTTDVTPRVTNIKYKNVSTHVLVVETLNDTRDGYGKFSQCVCRFQGAFGAPKGTPEGALIRTIKGICSVPIETIGQRGHFVSRRVEVYKTDSGYSGSWGDLRPLNLVDIEEDIYATYLEIQAVSADGYPRTCRLHVSKSNVGISGNGGWVNVPDEDVALAGLTGDVTHAWVVFLHGESVLQTHDTRYGE
jgi:hypothetical protein